VIAKHWLDLFENFFLPESLECSLIWHVLVVYRRDARVRNVLKCDHEVGKLFPSFHLESQFDRFVFLQVNVFTHHIAVVHLKLATWLRFRQRQTSCELADEHLVGECSVDEMSRSIKLRTDLELVSWVSVNLEG